MRHFLSVCPSVGDLHCTPPQWYAATLEFLVMGRYPLSLVRTMPAKYSMFGERFVPCRVEFNVSLLRGDESGLGFKTNSS